MTSRVWPVFEIATTTSPGSIISAVMNIWWLSTGAPQGTPEQREFLLGVDGDDAGCAKPKNSIRRAATNTSTACATCAGSKVAARPVQVRQVEIENLGDDRFVVRVRDRRMRGRAQTPTSVR